MALAALLLLVVNDHVLKAAWPGVVTGKLSDVAGLVLAPLVLQAVWEVARWVAGREWGPSALVIGVTTALVGFGFVAVKTLEPAADVYRTGLGALQWPFAAFVALVGSGTLPELRPVAFVRDPTDLIALPALLIPIIVGRRRGLRRVPGYRRADEPDADSAGQHH